MSQHAFFVVVFSLCQELLPFHLKEALSSFSLAYSNGEQHYFYVLGVLLSKIKVT
jgi:hypothetical protein